MSLTRILLWIMIGSLVLAAVLGIASVVLPTTWQLQARILGTCLLVGGFTIPAFVCAAMIRQRRLTIVMWSALAALAGALGLWLSFIWVGYSDWRVEEDVFRLSSVLTIAGCWGALLGLLMMLRIHSRRFVLVRVATLTVTGVLAVLGIFAFVVEFDPDWFLRTLLVLTILGACGTLVTPLLAVIEMIRSRSDHETVSFKAKVQMTCPRCGASQHLNTGTDKCSQCNLRIDINFEEPRCACGYQLYKLQGDICPECGREIPKSERWAGLQSPAHPDQPAAHPAGDTLESTR